MAEYTAQPSEREWSQDTSHRNYKWESEALEIEKEEKMNMRMNSNINLKNTLWKIVRCFVGMK